MKIVKQIILAFIILVSSIATAQNDNKKLSDEDKIRLVNTIGVYCLQTSINQENKSDDTAVPPEYISLEKFKEGKSEVLQKLQSTKSLLDEFIKLRDDNKKLDSNYFEEKIFSDNGYKSINGFFAKKNRITNYKKDLEALKKVAIRISEDAKVVEKTKVAEKAKVAEKTKAVEKTKAENSSISVIYVLLISLFAFMAGFITSKVLQKKTAIVDMKDGRPTSQSAYMSEEAGATGERNEASVSEFESENVGLKREIFRLNQELEKSKKENDQLLFTNQDLMKELPDTQEETKVLNTQPIAPVVNKKYFYYAPDNGIFTAESKESDAVYFLEEKNNGVVSFKLNINNKSTFSTLIFSISEYIYSGCSSENSPNEETKDIIIIEDGEAIKTNDGWKITKKCKIEFI